CANALIKPVAPINVSTTNNYSVLVTDINNCTNTANHQFTVNPLPTALINNPSVICDGSTITLIASGGGTYLWSNNSTTQTINVSSGGVFTVTVTNQFLCTATASASTTVFPNPIPIITGQDTICYGASTFLFAGNYSSYLWSTGAATNSIYANTPGNIIVTVTDSNGCTGSSPPFLVTVLPESIPIISASGPLHLCPYQSVTLTADTGLIYLWSDGETTQSITVTQSGIYTVYVMNISGCPGYSAPVMTFMHTKPTAGFISSTEVICDQGVLLTTVNNSVNDSGSVYNWDMGNGVFDTVTSPSQLYITSGSYTVTLVVTTPHGCTDTVVQTVNAVFDDFPKADFKLTPDYACLFNSEISFTDLSENANSWKWDFGDGGTSSNQNPSHYYDALGKFTIKLVIANADGCISEAENELYISPFYIPNAFTPNGDGKNDAFFDAGFVINVASYKMRIFSRWGKKVFESNDYNSFWYGNGALQGVYVYVINVTTKSGKKFEYKGTVTLVR
ncbi:MAG: PKD domain-containing protein, partial [Bacteroidota bacterium]